MATEFAEQPNPFMTPMQYWREVLTTPKRARRFAALVAVTLTLYAGYSGYRAIDSEITGQAIYAKSRSSREAVTREDSPSKFRAAVNMRWAVSGFCFIVAVASFTFYRKLDDCV